MASDCRLAAEPVTARRSDPRSSQRNAPRTIDVVAFLRRHAWIPAGLAVAALIAAAFGTHHAWSLMTGYALINLIGTAYALGLNTDAGAGVDERSKKRDLFDQRLPVILKAGFVAQLPLGLLIVLLESV